MRFFNFFFGNTFSLSKNALTFPYSTQKDSCLHPGGTVLVFFLKKLVYISLHWSLLLVVFSVKPIVRNHPRPTRDPAYHRCATVIDEDVIIRSLLLMAYEVRQ